MEAIDRELASNYVNGAWAKRSFIAMARVFKKLGCADCSFFRNFMVVILLTPAVASLTNNGFG